jgi:hypothetical protein
MVEVERQWPSASIRQAAWIAAPDRHPRTRSTATGVLVMGGVKAGGGIAGFVGGLW